MKKLNDIDVARICMKAYPNGDTWTWHSSLTKHIEFGSESNYFPFLEKPDEFMIVGGRCVEEQLYAMEKGWTV